MIPVLIGQIGAGKTEIGRLAAAIQGNRLSIDDLRRHRAHASMQDFATAAIELAATGPLILECTGAADDFEDLLIRIGESGKRPFVILLECSIGTALKRIRERFEWSPPRGGRTWAPHLRWTELRLRQVPVDISTTTEVGSLEQIAERILIELREAEKNEIRLADVRRIGKFTFSRLAMFDVCPLAFRYKYVDRRPELVETEFMFLGKRLHEILFLLYKVPQGEYMSEIEAQKFLVKRISDTLPPITSASQKQTLISRAAEILSYHHRHVYQHEELKTLALEKAFSVRLAPNLIFNGLIDRIAIAPSGTFQVIDYKTSARKQTSRPRIPDLLQVTAYGAATLLEYNLSSLLSYRHLLPTDEQEPLSVRGEDLPRVWAALARWIDRVIRNRQYKPRPGKHCASCQFNPICPAASQPPDATVLYMDSSLR